jgi:hypothetical protein
MTNYDKDDILDFDKKGKKGRDVLEGVKNDV